MLLAIWALRMTYEERTNRIGTLLREEILRNSTRPSHLSDTAAQAELRNMVDDLNREWPTMAADRFESVCEALAREVRASHTSRTWPTIAALLKALKASMKGNAELTEEQSEAAIMGMVRDWWTQFRGPLPTVATEEHAVQLHREGLATWGELRRSLFPIPFWAREDAMLEPDPAHPGIMADLIALGERLRANRAPRGSVRA